MRDYDDDFADEAAELAAADRRARNLQRALIAHPDPRDPDYPIPDTDDDEEE